MDTAKLKTVVSDPDCSLYQLATGSSTVTKIIASTPESRWICNDPLLVGVEYTDALSSACSKVLRSLQENQIMSLHESKSVVLHILRGGLNFGLRQACSEAFGWNHHSSAFISAQRARAAHDQNDWIITESAYQKIHFHPQSVLIFGDVVATGTSLDFALHEVAARAQQQECQIDELLFFTIGGARSHQIIEDLEKEKLQPFSSYKGSVVVYLEGIFHVATEQTPIAIKLNGTDLLRRDAVLAPEFLESQYSNPSFPLERCAIYDAGSRAFELGEYLNDVEEYWTATANLVERENLSFNSLLQQRAPELDPLRFEKPDIGAIYQSRLSKIADLKRHCRV